MNRQWKTIISILGAVTISAFGVGTGHCQTEAEIFLWTAQMLEVEGNIAMPQVHWVDQAELQAVFVKNNKASYLRWENKWGVEQAQALLDQYLTEIVGLYETETRAVYVGNFLGFCRGEAILAHEFTHFFQLSFNGETMAWGEDGEAALKMAREMEAYKIENLYTQTFCQSDNGLEMAE